MARYTIEDTTITNIADAIREQNGSTNKYNPSQMPDAIRAIEVGGSSTDEWQPQSDWWDIKNILENDTEDYIGKIITLLPNSDVSTKLLSRLISDVYPSKIKTSDGIEYTNVNADITHFWDTSKDKPCSQGYSTRYIIYYYNTSTGKLGGNLGSYTFPGNGLYMIIKNMNLTAATNNHIASSNLYKFEMINGVFAPETLNLGYMRNIRKIVGLDLSNVISLDRFAPNSFFAYDFFKDYGEQWNTSKVTNFNSAFNTTGLRYIPSLDFSSATNVGSMFNTANNLIEISEISNIKISGINITQATYLNHDTLVRFLNALYDYASEGSTDTYTLTLGTTLLAKLTDEEKAIATNKGWTLA